MALSDDSVQGSNQERKQCSSNNGSNTTEDEVFCAGKKNVALCDEGARARHAEAVRRVKLDSRFVRSEEDSLNADKKEAHGDAGQGEGVGQRVGLPVHDEEAYQEEAEDGESYDPGEVVRPVNRRGRAEVDCVHERDEAAKMICSDEEPAANRELYQRIAPRDFCSTVTATGAEGDPTHKRNVVVPADGVAAARAVGAGFGDAFVQREARDAHVQEAAEKQAHEEGGNRKSKCGRHGPQYKRRLSTALQCLESKE